VQADLDTGDIGMSLYKIWPVAERRRFGKFALTFDVKGTADAHQKNPESRESRLT
jgi:hypothetical protein